MQFSNDSFVSEIQFVQVQLYNLGFVHCQFSQACMDVNVLILLYHVYKTIQSPFISLLIVLKRTEADLQSHFQLNVALKKIPLPQEVNQSLLLS